MSDDYDEYESFKQITLSIDSRKEIMQQRMKKGLSQIELANLISIPKTNMRDIENGKLIPNDKTISILEKELNIVLSFDCNLEITIDDIKINWRLIQYVKNQNHEICEIAVTKNWQAIKFIRNQTPKLCELAVKKNWRALEFIKKQTPELCKYGFENDWHCIQYLKFQTPEISEIAVKNNGLSIQYIIEQTDSLCELAVTHNWKALKFVRNQTKNVCIAALKNNYMAIEMVRNQTESICLKALEIDWKALKFIKLRPLKLVKNSTPLTDDCCSICQTNEEENWYQLIRCKHKFHSSCFDLCDKSSYKKCPLCRTEYVLPEEMKDIIY